MTVTGNSFKLTVFVKSSYTCIGDYELQCDLRVLQGSDLKVKSVLLI